LRRRTCQSRIQSGLGQLHLKIQRSKTSFQLLQLQALDVQLGLRARTLFLHTLQRSVQIALSRIQRDLGLLQLPLQVRVVQLCQKLSLFNHVVALDQHIDHTPVGLKVQFFLDSR